MNNESVSGSQASSRNGVEVGVTHLLRSMSGTCADLVTPLSQIICHTQRHEVCSVSKQAGILATHKADVPAGGLGTC